MNQTKEALRRAYLEAHISAYVSSQTGKMFVFEQVDYDVRENLQTDYEPVPYRHVNGYAEDPWKDTWTLPYGISGDVPDHITIAKAIDVDIWHPIYAEDGTPLGEPTNLDTAIERMLEYIQGE